MSFPAPRKLTGYLWGPLLGMIALAAIPAAASTAADPQGVWITEGKDAVLSIGQCGRRLCGRILWIASPRDKAGRLRVDHNNPEPAKQNRQICGLNIISSLRHAGDGTWDGYIYDPSDGQTYSGTVTVLSPDRLRVRAYSFFRLFGRSETWTRILEPKVENLIRECRDGSSTTPVQEADAVPRQTPAAVK